VCRKIEVIALITIFAACAARGGQIALWSLDESSGTTAHDSIGGFDGTLTGMDPTTDWVAGQVGGALDFDGIDDRVSLPSLSINSNTMTITAWIKSNANQSGYTGLVFRRSGDENASGFGFSGTANELGYHWNNTKWDWHSGLVVPNGKWVFVAISIGTTQASVYLGDPDASSLQTTTTSHSTHTEQFNGANIGCDSYLEANRYFNGSIDEVGIWDEALAQDQIQTVYNYGTVSVVEFQASSSGALETVSPADIAVVVTRPEAGRTYTVDYAVTGGSATSGDDYSPLDSGTLTFNPGQTAASISVTIINDGIDENDETIEVTLSNVTGEQVVLGEAAVHTYTIIDPRPSVQFSAEVDSGAENVQIMHGPREIAVVLSNAAASTVTVNYAVTGGSADQGTDYEISGGILSFPAGETTRDISVTIIDDALVEGNETILLGLSNAVGAKLGPAAQHAYTIVDDDPREPYHLDINNDGFVDEGDLFIIIENWLQSSLDPSEL